MCVTPLRQKRAGPRKPLWMKFSCFHVCPTADSGSVPVISNIRFGRVFSTTWMQKYFHYKLSMAMHMQEKGMSRRLEFGRLWQWCWLKKKRKKKNLQKHKNHQISLAVSWEKKKSQTTNQHCMFIFSKPDGKDFSSNVSVCISPLLLPLSTHHWS